MDRIFLEEPSTNPGTNIFSNNLQDQDNLHTGKYAEEREGLLGTTRRFVGAAAGRVSELVCLKGSKTSESLNKDMTEPGSSLYGRSLALN